MAVAYAIVGWLLVQIATQVFPFLEIPNWVVRLVIMLVAAGFPVALVIAWAFELTPEGLKRTEDVDLQAGSGSKKRAWIYVAVIGAAFSIGLFFVGRYTVRNTASAARTELPAKSIAVLPFDNLSRDPDNAFFAEGVQDEILTRLAKVADLKVIARTSTFRVSVCRADPESPRSSDSTRLIDSLERFSDRRRSYVVGAFLRREVRNRTRLVHRHRRLLEVAHHRAERAASDVEGDRARNGAGPRAEAEGKLLRLPTGDGGALVFRTSPEAPVRCAIEISKALKGHPELRVRMGIHSGPVNEITDLNDKRTSPAPGSTSRNG